MKTENGSYLTLTDSWIESNTAENEVIYSNVTNTTINNTTVKGNFGKGFVFNSNKDVKIYDSVFSENRQETYVLIHARSLLLERSDIYSNISRQLLGAASHTITDSFIRDNSMIAALIFASAGDLNISGSSILRNKSEYALIDIIGNITAVDTTFIGSTVKKQRALCRQGNPDC